MLNASELKYPTRDYFGLDVYVIPSAEKYEVLKAAYLGEPVPGPNAVLEDIHTEREFLFKDLLVVKNGDLVELETPFFMDGGGSVIDWVPALSPRQRELRDAKEVAFQAGYDDGIQRQREGLRKPFDRPSRNDKFNRSVAREYAAGYRWGCQKRLNDLKATGKEDRPVGIEDVLAALAQGHYKISVFSEYLFIYQQDDGHLQPILVDKLDSSSDEITVDVCGQRYQSTVFSKQWTDADTNAIPLESRLVDALCNIPEYKDMTLESYLKLNYTREEIEKQLAAYGTEFYFDFTAPHGTNIVVRPPSHADDVFSSWDELKARKFLSITIDQAVDYLYTNRIAFSIS